MSNQTKDSKPVNLGEIKPPNPTTPKKRRIPRILQGISPIFDHRWGHEKEVKTYGLWTLRCIRNTIGLGHGKFAKVGDTFQIPGNHALMLVGNGSCEFVDERLEAEEKFFEEMNKEAARLGLDKTAVLDPAQFNPRRP